MTTIEPKGEWTPQEKWVWEQLSLGKRANLNEYDKPPAETEFDPKKDDDFKDDEKWGKRIISSKFLQAILLDEPYKGALTRIGVTIIGAWFKGKTSLIEADMKSRLFLMSSRFDSHIDLTYSKAERTISFIGSKFTKATLHGAKIGGQLNLEGTTFSGKLDMDDLQVDRSLFMNYKAKFSGVVLKGAQIGGQLSSIDSMHKGKLDMQGIEIGSHLLFHGTTFEDSIDLTFAKIGGGVVANNSSLKSLNLTGSVIEKELNLGYDLATIPTWMGEALLTLRNTEADALVATRKSWPKDIDMVGFKYSRLGGFTQEGKPAMDTAKIKWFEGWLLKQKSFSPQPYEQLASVLREEGHEKMARDILYAKRERQRLEEPHSRWRTVFLWLMKTVIGYGYRIHRVLGWIFGATIIGALFAHFGADIGCYFPTEGLEYFLDINIYSLDMLLPLVELREAHYAFDIDTLVKYYFYVHKMVGYVLASFLIAGLSGLTK